MKPPNLILLSLKECRWDTPGFAGYAAARTANLNALATHGLCYTQGLVSELEPERNLLRLLGEGSLSLSSTASAAGYDTMAAGHFPSGSPAGFERVEACAPALADLNSLSLRAAFGATRSSLSEVEHPVAQCGNHAVRLLRTASEPFFMMISFPAPGVLLDPPAPWDRMFDAGMLSLPEGFQLPARIAAGEPGGLDFSQMTEPRFRKALACYHGLLAFIDHQIGRILATLASRAVGHTMFAMTASGGHYLGQHGRTAREANPAPWEALIRVPMVLAGATTVGPPATLSSPVCTDDFRQALATLLRGEKLPHELSDTAFASSAPRIWEVSPGVRVARRPGAKAWWKDGALQGVYDLDTDPFEYHNLMGTSAGDALAHSLLEGIA